LEIVAERSRKPRRIGERRGLRLMRGLDGERWRSRGDEDVDEMNLPCGQGSEHEHQAQCR
jgi:hypothetical protein